MVKGDGIAHAFFDHQGSIIEQGVRAGDMEFFQWFLQPVEQFIAMRAEGECLPRKEQGAVPEVTSFDGILFC